MNSHSIPWILGALFAAVTVLAVAWKMFRDSGEGFVPPKSGPHTLEDVKRLAAAGQKIQAIKMYREITGAGLKDAKDAVESGVLGPVPNGVPNAPNMESPTMESIKQMAQAGNLIMAIKMYREITGLGLAESKEAVERMRDSG